MQTLEGLLTKYCQIFGYSSCGGLSWMEISFLVAVGAFVFIVGLSVIRRVVTGISD